MKQPNVIRCPLVPQHLHYRPRHSAPLPAVALIGRSKTSGCSSTLPLWFNLTFADKTTPNVSVNVQNYKTEKCNPIWHTHTRFLPLHLTHPLFVPSRVHWHNLNGGTLPL